MGFWNRIVQKLSRQSFKMVQERGNGFYAWNGRLYHSDVVRACIRPKTKAIGKAVAKHIRTTRTQEGERVEVNPDAYPLSAGRAESADERADAAGEGGKPTGTEP